MLRDCVWKLLGNRIECETCERSLAWSAGAPYPRRNCRGRCVHLGDQVGEILVECESCQGRVRIKQPAHHCAAFGDRGRCLPAYIPLDLKVWTERKPESDIYHLCHGCNRFRAAV